MLALAQISSRRDAKLRRAGHGDPRVPGTPGPMHGPGVTQAPSGPLGLPSLIRPQGPLSFCAMAAVFTLNHHATYVHWHCITLARSNVIVFAVMFSDL